MNGSSQAEPALAPLGFARADLDGHLVALSDGAAAILGWPRAALLQRSFLDLVHAPDQASGLAQLARLRRGEIDHYRLEVRYLRQDGSTSWVLLTVTLLHDARGAACGFCASVEDIGARKRAERVAQDSAQHLQLALAAGQLGDWHWDAATDTIDLAPRAAAMFGLDGDARPTWTQARELLHPADREPARLAGQQALELHGDFAAEFRIRLPGGGQRWVAARGRGRYGADGRPTDMIGVVQDITQRRQAEDALQDEALILSLLNRTGTSLAARLDLQSLVQAVTDIGTELSGARYGAFFNSHRDADGDRYQLYALSGAPLAAFERLGHPRATELLGPTMRGAGVVRIDDVRADPRYGRHGPHFGMPEGHLEVRSYLAVAVVSRSGAPLGGLIFGHPEPGIFTERSERLIVGVAAQAAVALDNAHLYEAAAQAVRQRDQLLEAERAARAAAERASLIKDEFLATLSHELRTPLNAILGWSQILAQGRSGPDDIARAVEVIERNARVQTRLIEDLLDMNRIVSGKVRLDVQPTVLAEVVEAALQGVRLSAEAKGVRLRRILDPQAGKVAGDPNRLQQVVWNLLSNAVKFTPRGGTIEVLLQRLDGQLEILVTDSGAGIDPDFLPQVFDRFRKGDAAGHGGLGLGLAIVKQLVELHGGTVSASSAGPGLGSSFAVRLPLAQPVASPCDLPAPSPSGRFAVPPPRSLEGVRVLLVEDGADTRALISSLLEQCGASVQAAASATAALQLLAAARPDVLISGIGLPGMDGYQLLRAVRQLPAAQGGNVPAIALTAFARGEDRTQALLAGFQLHVSKPVEVQELVAAVLALVRR